MANLDALPALQANYEVVPSLSPYLLVDWILTPFARIWSVYDVGRVFVAASMIINYGGVLLLSVVVCSRLTIWPALALPILYNYAFSWGFINFNFGIGPLFIFLALWFRIYHRSIVQKIAVLLCISLLLYITHLLVFGLFAAIASAHSLSVSFQKNGLKICAILRDTAPVILVFVMVFSIYFIWLVDVTTVGVKVTEYGKIGDKIRMLLSPTFFSGDLVDYTLFAVYWIVGLSLALRGKLRLAENVAFAIILLAIICLTMPNTLFGVWGVDFRLPPVFLMFLIAITQPATLDERPSRPLAAVVIATMVMTRAIAIWPQFQLADHQFAEFKAATRSISEGARVLVSQDYAPRKLALPGTNFWHLAQISIIERNTFVPFLFTEVTQIRPTVRNRDFDTGSGHPLPSELLISGLDPEFIALNRNRRLDAYHRVYWADWPANFDYLLQINPTPLDHRVAVKLGEIEHHSFFDIAKIKK